MRGQSILRPQLCSNGATCKSKSATCSSRSTATGAGRILKVEGHSGGSAEKKFGAPHFSVVPTQFLMELGAQPSKLNNSNCHF